MPSEIVPDENYSENWKMPCTFLEHNPPNMIVIPPGSKLVHTCPSCGEVTVIRPNIVIC